MDYAQFVKKLRLPDGFTPPKRLVHDGVVATAITRAELSDDVLGINASIDLITETRGGGWPTEPVTEAFNEVALVWHELEFREGCVPYVRRSRRGRNVSRVLLPLSARPTDRAFRTAPPLRRRRQLVGHACRYEQGYYTKLYDAFRDWLAGELPFWRPYYSNRRLPWENPADAGF